MGERGILDTVIFYSDTLPKLEMLNYSVRSTNYECQIFCTEGIIVIASWWIDS